MLHFRYLWNFKVVSRRQQLFGSQNQELSVLDIQILEPWVYGNWKHGRVMRKPGRRLLISKKPPRTKLWGNNMDWDKKEPSKSTKINQRDRRETKKVQSHKTRRIWEWSLAPKAAMRSSEVRSEECPLDLGMWPLFLSTSCPVHLESSLSHLYWSFLEISVFFQDVSHMSSLLWSLRAKLFPCCGSVAYVAYLSIVTGNFQFICVPWQNSKFLNSPSLYKFCWTGVLYYSCFAS